MRAILAALLLAPAVAFADLADDIVGSAVEASLSDANMFTGEDLFRRYGRIEFFVGYVSGVADTGSMTGPAVRRYCMPDGVTNAQMADVAHKFLRENPARRHLGAAHLVRQSFTAAWPCPVVPAAMPGRRPAL